MYNTRVIDRFDFTGSFPIIFFILMFLLIVFFTIKVLCNLNICFLFRYWLAPSWKIFHIGTSKFAGDGLQISSFAVRL